MLSQFMQNIGSRSNRVRTQEQFQSCLFCSSNETIGSSLVSCNVHITARFFYLRLYTVHIGSSAVGIMTIIISSLNNFYICLGYTWLLLEFLTKEIESDIQVPAEQPAHQSQGEHITTFQDGFIIHTAVCQSLFYHFCDRTCNDTIWIYTQLCQWICRLELCLLKVCLFKCIGINNDSSIRFSKLQLSL